MGTYIPLPFAEITKQYAQTMNHTPITLLGYLVSQLCSHINFSVGLNPLMFSMLILQLLMMTKLFGFDALSQPQIEFFMQVITLALTILQAVLLVFGMTPQRISGGTLR